MRIEPSDHPIASSGGFHVPEISRFYGISIRMYFADHPRPRFHVRYAGHKASIEIRSLAVVSGRLPVRARRLVLRWARSHRAELL